MLSAAPDSVLVIEALLSSILYFVSSICFLPAAMLGRLRRLCSPALAAPATRPLLVVTTGTKALHIALSLGTKESPQDCERNVGAMKRLADLRGNS